ncbi:MAG: GGDEF domain-containing response regulator [Candidatus Aminicenantes bacterium]|nr:MAG: GGDEF domain-containing response regulator [Candidatus Aminicenantes bacterium]
MDLYSNLGILIVDKNEPTCHKIGVYLSKKYWVWTFNAGKEALAKLKQVQADILISALKLKDMEGLNFIKKAKKIFPQIYVIVIASSPDLSKKMEQLKDIAYDFITKPVDEKQLNLVLKRAVGHQQLLKKKEIYKELSILDHLTKVYNRRYLDLMLAREIERSKRVSRPFSLLMVDIDNFKEYNDKNGHPAGDSLLKRFAHLLMRSSRILDSVYRYGGDEFLVLLPETSKKDAINLSQRIQSVVKEEKFEGVETFPRKRLAISIGLACFPEDGFSTEALLSLADRMMFKAKKLAENKICFLGQSLIH